MKSLSLFRLGRMSLSQWSEAMESVTNYKLPWRLLREKLAVMNENNEILYENTLQLIENDDDIVSSIIKRNENTTFSAINYSQLYHF
jgi:hypothetical protein